MSVTPEKITRVFVKYGEGDDEAFSFFSSISLTTYMLMGGAWGPMKNTLWMPCKMYF